MLIAGAIAGQSGAGAASLAAPAAAPAVSAFGVPAESPAAADAVRSGAIDALRQATNAVTPAADAPATPAGNAKAAAPDAKAATGSAAAKKYDYERASYVLTMRSGAIEPYAEIPRQQPTDIGYSEVEINKDLGQTSGRCEVFAAAYYLGEEVEEGVLGAGAAPTDAGGDVNSGYVNPTAFREVRPDAGEAGNSSLALRPQFPASGNGPNITGECSDDFTTGSAIGEITDAAGFELLGSSTDTSIDKKTGVATSTGRAYLTSLEGAFDSASSLMQVTWAAGKEPKITFRVSFFNSDSTESGFNQNGFTLGGTDVPAQMFVDTFNTQAAANAKNLEAVGPAGIQILEPQVFPDEDTGRTVIIAPVAQGNLGFDARMGTLGQNQGLRFGSIAFTGVNDTEESAS